MTEYILILVVAFAAGALSVWAVRHRTGLPETPDFSAESNLASAVLRSMREEPQRWGAPDHGWNVELFCLRDDGLEVMQDMGTWNEPGKVRIQGLGDPSNHYSQSMKLAPVRFDPGWFGSGAALLREMKRIHWGKDKRKAEAGLAAICVPRNGQ